MFRKNVRALPNFEFLYERAVRGPMHILRRLWSKEEDEPSVQTSYQYLLELMDRLEETLILDREELKKSQSWQKRYFDRTCRRRELEEGDRVLLLRPTDRNKLVMHWKGPYVVERRVGPVDYGVNIMGKSKVFDVNLLKRYYSRISEADQKRDSSEERGAVLELENSAIISADCGGGQDDAADDDKLFDLSPCWE